MEGFRNEPETYLIIFFPLLLTQEALKLQQDVRKKKQEILEKHIETQKVR